MADYVLINNLANKGKIAISRLVFDSIVNNAISKIADVSKSSSKMKKNQAFSLNRPIRTSIRKGVAHISLYLDVKKDSDVDSIKAKVEKQVGLYLNSLTEQVPYDVDISFTGRN